MNEYSNLDTAIEIMAFKIAHCQDGEELEMLRKERDEMYNGNIEIINKIITVYGKQLKEIYNKK